MRVLALLAGSTAVLATSCTSPDAASAPSSASPQAISLYDALGMKEPGLRGAELDVAVRRANAFPLGSERNPVRTTGLAGQRRYLARLRCSDGSAPSVRGRGIGSPSPFGGVTDIYSVECKRGTPARAAIAMDLYHEHVETRPVPGFAIIRP